MWTVLGAETNLFAMLSRNADALSQDEFRVVNKARSSLTIAYFELERALRSGK